MKPQCEMCNTKGRGGISQYAVTPVIGGYQAMSVCRRCVEHALRAVIAYHQGTNILGD